MSLRVAVVAACPFPARRGTPLRVERLTAALAARGHAVEVFSYHVADDERMPPFPVTRTRKRIVRRAMPPGPRWEKLLLDPLLCYQLRKGLRQGAFDLIHAHHVEGLLLGHWARPRAGSPMVFDAHTLLASELPTYPLGIGRRSLRALGWWLDGLLPRHADHVIAVTRQMQELLVGGHGVPENRVTVVSNGVELEHFARVDSQTTAEAARLIYTGTLAPYQGIELLLKAFAIARRQRPELSLCLCVQSSVSPYERLTRELGIGDAIEVVHDRFKDLPANLARAQIAVLPRVHCDGIPQKLLNYMAAAKPIVAFAGSAKLLTHERTGLIVPDGDTSAFAAAIVGLVERPQRALELGQRARAFVAAHHSWEHAAEQVEQVYLGLLRRRGTVEQVQAA